MSNASKQSISAYSPEGRLYQVEYAMKAMNLGTTTIGIKTENGTILLSEKKIVSSLQNPESIKKHYRISDHIALGFSGLSADVKPIVDIARDFVINHEYLYNEKCKVERVVQHISERSLSFDEDNDDSKIFSRPFGVSLIFIGYDDQPRLFSLDPSGKYDEYTCKSIGSGCEVIETLFDQYLQHFTDLNSTLKVSLAMLKDVMKESISCTNVEVVTVSKDGINILNAEYINNLLQ